MAANGENIMLLENKNAVIYGAAGAVGGAVARPACQDRRGLRSASAQGTFRKRCANARQ